MPATTPKTSFLPASSIQFTEPEIELDAAFVQGYVTDIELGKDIPTVMTFWDGDVYWAASNFEIVAAAEATTTNVAVCIKKGNKSDAQAYIVQQNSFSYENLEPTLSKETLLEANTIKRLMKLTASHVIEIGKILTNLKQKLGKLFRGWIKHEFSWSIQTARRFIQASEFSATNPQIAEFVLDISALYLLSTKSCPPAAVEEAMKKAGDGEEITHLIAKELVSKHSPPRTPRSTKSSGLGTTAPSTSFEPEELVDPWGECYPSYAIEPKTIAIANIATTSQVTGSIPPLAEAGEPNKLFLPTTGFKIPSADLEDSQFFISETELVGISPSKLSLPVELKPLVKEAAARQNISIVDWVKEVLTDALRSIGLLCTQETLPELEESIPQIAPKPQDTTDKPDASPAVADDSSALPTDLQLAQSTPTTNFLPPRLSTIASNISTPTNTTAMAIASNNATPTDTTAMAIASNIQSPEPYYALCTTSIPQKEPVVTTNSGDSTLRSTSLDAQIPIKSSIHQETLTLTPYTESAIVEQTEKYVESEASDIEDTLLPSDDELNAEPVDLVANAPELYFYQPVTLKDLTVGDSILVISPNKKAQVPDRVLRIVKSGIQTYWFGQVDNKEILEGWQILKACLKPVDCAAPTKPNIPTNGNTEQQAHLYLTSFYPNADFHIGQCHSFPEYYLASFKKWNIKSKTSLVGQKVILKAGNRGQIDLTNKVGIVVEQLGDDVKIELDITNRWTNQPAQVTLPLTEIKPYLFEKDQIVIVKQILDEQAWIGKVISLPDFHHQFVVVTNQSTGEEITVFSYGDPQQIRLGIPQKC